MLSLHQAKFKAMGSPCKLQIYTTSPDLFDSLVQDIRAEILRLEIKYTRFNEDSQTSKINKAAGTDNPVPIDSETFQLLQYADTLHEQSNGLFDITSGVLRQAWDFKSQTLPSPSTLDALLPIIGWQHVSWDQFAIRLPKQGMQIDFGGYVKEYAADVVSTRCLDQGISHGLINLGGDIRVIGPHPDNTPWKIGIQHPRKAGGIATLELDHGAIATSGDYERFMMVQGKRYCHLLNPYTGRPIDPKYASITVAAECCLLAGSFSSIGMLKSPEDPDWLADTGVAYLTIQQDMALGGSLNPG